MKITFLYAPSAKDSSQHRDKMRLKDISSYYALKLTSREVVVDDQWSPWTNSSILQLF